MARRGGSNEDENEPETSQKCTSIVPYTFSTGECKIFLSARISVGALAMYQPDACRLPAGNGFSAPCHVWRGQDDNGAPADAAVIASKRVGNLNDTRQAAVATMPNITGTISDFAEGKMEAFKRCQLVVAIELAVWGWEVRREGLSQR